MTAVNNGVSVDVSRNLGSTTMSVVGNVRSVKTGLPQLLAVMNHYTDGVDFTTLAAMLGGISTTKAGQLYTVIVNANTAFSSSVDLNLLADAVTPTV